MLFWKKWYRFISFNLCRDLKDFYFSRRYASDDYEFLEEKEYKEYIDRFYKLLNELKTIRNSL